MDALWDCLSCCYNESTTIELTNLDVLRKRLESASQTMLEVFQDLHDEDGVIVKIIDDEADSSAKAFGTDDNDLSGYLI